MKAVVILVCFVLTLFATITTPPIINEGVSATQVYDMRGSNEFGRSVGVFGDNVIVGAWEDGADPGDVYIYQKQNDGTLVKTASVSPTDVNASFFGGHVAIYEDTFIVGAMRSWVDDLSEAGTAYIFKKQDDGSWAQEARLFASDKEKTGLFGVRVSLYKDTAVVGAIFHDSEAGNAYIFQRDSDGNWNETAKLVASDHESGDHFGYCVSIYKDTIIVSAEQGDSADINNTGCVYVFEKDSDGNWNETVKLTASDHAEGDWFGKYVSLYEDTLIVTADHKEIDGITSAGSAYIFQREDDGSWTQVAKLTASDKEQSAYFGFSAVVNENMAMVGAHKEDANGVEDSGSVYLFQKQTDGSWKQTQKIVSNLSNYFGSSVALDKGYAMVGAYAAKKAYAFEISHDISIMENDTFVQDINVTDENETTLSYTLSGIDADKFNLDSNVSLAFKTAPDYENPTDADQNNIYKLVFSATDDNNATSTLNINVRVVDNDDEDNDTLSDNWERQYFGNLDQNASGDYDNDNLSNKDEYSVGTNPTNFDTDGDGLSDGYEVNTTLSNPTNPDTDGDGLGDGYEVNTTHTDPTLKDSDGDGANDGVEFNFNTDPLDVNSTITLNANTSQANGHIVLTQNTGGQAGSAFIEKSHEFLNTTGFHAHFKMGFVSNMTDPADGMSFILQNDENNDSAVGGSGGSIGYTDINNSIAVAFVTYQTREIHLLKDGDMTTLSSIAFPSYITDTSIFYTWVDYDAVTHKLDIYNSSLDIKPSSPIMSYTIDLNATLKGRAFIGFSAGTGGNYEEHDVYSLDMNWTNDADLDGLTDAQEAIYDTNATNPDTDGDGIWDKDEIFTYQTNPKSTDSDGDTIDDYQEVFVYHTNPNSSDSDGDTIGDAQEIQNGDDPTTPPLVISPNVYMSPIFTTTSPTFTLTNTGETNVTLPTFNFTGFSLYVSTNMLFSSATTCREGSVLQAGESCIIGLDMNMYSTGSCVLNIGNVQAFMYTTESLDAEASRRLPPVIDTLNIPEVMNAGEDYNLTFSVVGYDDDYTLYMAFFNCEGITDGTCGDSYTNPQRFDEALELHPYHVEDANWTYNHKTAQQFSYSYNFTPSEDEFNDGNTSIVIRFYYKTKKAAIAGDPSISLIIPGNLGQTYYDVSGRRIEKTINK